MGYLYTQFYRKEGKAIMNVTLIGVQDMNFTGRDGNEINGVKVFFAYPDENTYGSPFKNIQFPDEMEYFLGILNYYVPFQGMVNIALAWTSCIAIYYVYQMILRKINAIE